MTIDYARICEPGFIGPVMEPFAARLAGYDETRREVRIDYEVDGRWLNGAGVLQGGVQCVLLDHCCTGAALCAAAARDGGFRILVPTLELKASFLAAAMPGVLRGTGRVLRLGQAVSFLEAELHDAQGRLVARASATTLVRAKERP